MKKFLQTNEFIFLFSTVLLLAVSCKTQFRSTTPKEDLYIKITPTDIEKENYTSPSLKKFIQRNEGCSVVVRDTEAAKGEGISGNSESSNLCLLLEEALMKEGYNVRDRVIFESVIEKMGEIVSYEQLSQKTGTDLIFEITLKGEKYSVSEYYIGANGTQTKGFTYKKEIGKTSKGYPIYDNYAPISYTLSGYSVTIKIIMLRDNKIAGMHTYYYTPCDKTEGGCKIALLKSDQNPLLRYYEKDRIPEAERDLSDRVSQKNENKNKELISFLQRVISKMMSDIKK